MNDNQFMQLPNSWRSTKLETRENNEKNGYGSYAIAPILKGELLAMFGGTVVEYSQLRQLSEYRQQIGIQIDDNLFLVTAIIGDGDYLNHSCDPNAGLWGQMGLVALRDITVGEEVCFDYAMCDSVDYDEFECGCGTSQCRGIIRGTDWQIPALWERYDGYYSPYLQRKINARKQEKVAVMVNGHNHK